MSGERLPRFEPLGRTHARAAFSCSHPELTIYLQHLALQHMKKKIAATTVLLTEDATTIAAYHTVTATRLDLGQLPPALAKRFPRYAEGVPATLLGRLAVAAGFEGKGWGTATLMNALERALAASERIGSAFIIVRAIDDRAARFYRKFGFCELPDDARRLFLPMATVADLIVG